MSIPLPSPFLDLPPPAAPSEALRSLLAIAEEILGQIDLPAFVRAPSAEYLDALMELVD